MSGVTPHKLARSARLLWWLLLISALACVVVGTVLITAPFTGLAALRWLLAASLILTGLSEWGSGAAASRPRAARSIALLWIVVGIAAAVWPGTTVVSLALVVGTTLVIGGALKLGAALFGDQPERVIVGISALASIVIGVVALSWPAVTVLILAVIFGLRTVAFGIGQVVLAVRLRTPATAQSGQAAAAKRRWPHRLRLIGALAALAASSTPPPIRCLTGLPAPSSAPRLSTASTTAPPPTGFCTSQPGTTAPR